MIEMDGSEHLQLWLQSQLRNGNQYTITRCETNFRQFR